MIKVAPACAIMIATFEYSKVVIVRLANMSNSAFDHSDGSQNRDVDNENNFRVDVKTRSDVL